MVEHGHRPGLAGKPLGKGRVVADPRREDFQRHQPVEPLLPGLIDHAHAAPAQQFQNLQVGEMGSQLGRRGRNEVGTLGRIAAARSGGLSCQSALEQTGRAEPPGRVGGQFGVTGRATVVCVHGFGVFVPSVSTISIGKAEKRLQGNRKTALTLTIFRRKMPSPWPSPGGRGDPVDSLSRRGRGPR